MDCSRAITGWAEGVVSGSRVTVSPRVLVVGASEGIGREFAILAARSGASVVLAARRADALAEVAEQAGGGHVVPVDVTDDASVAALVDAAVAVLGEIDLVLYAVGSASLRRVADTDRATWEHTLSTNLIGFNQLARRLIGVMAPSGIVAALSSEAADTPRDGLVAYAASKAALEISVKGWRAEHPRVRWSCVGVGATFPTAFGATFDPDTIGAIMETWMKRGLLQEDFMVPSEVAAHLLAVYTSALGLPSVNIEQLVLRSPSATIGTA
jgi:NAD(P)-dependent dehydrogenase (short-subunit alcohol dehydrogenase family)